MSLTAMIVIVVIAIVLTIPVGLHILQSVFHDEYMFKKEFEKEHKAKLAHDEVRRKNKRKTLNF